MASSRLLAVGVEVDDGVGDVGGGIRVAVVHLRHGGGPLGVIEDPRVAATAVAPPGAGR